MSKKKADKLMEEFFQARKGERAAEEDSLQTKPLCCYLNLSAAN
jgi:hypothetical protein